MKLTVWYNLEIQSTPVMMLTVLPFRDNSSEMYSILFWDFSTPSLMTYIMKVLIVNIGNYGDGKQN